MSGGRLVVLDRAGRAGKQYPLGEGLATLGSDRACDICVLRPDVSAHHATVVVHAHQTVVRNVGDGETLVNGVSVSVAALRHGDVLTLGDRELRWEYADPRRGPLHDPSPQMPVPRRGGGAGRGRRGSSPRAAPSRDRAVQLALELRHRASLPTRSPRGHLLATSTAAHLATGNAGGKQVAIVQPRRRDTGDQAESRAGRAPPPPPPTQATLWIESRKPRRARSSLPHSRPTPLRLTVLRRAQSAHRVIKIEAPLKIESRAGRAPPPPPPTQATLWIESRKPRRARSSLPHSRPTPLRLTVLRRAQSAHRVIKIEAPLKIDHTKQAAIMLMTGHTPKSTLTVSSQKKNKKSPSYVVKRPRRSERAGSNIVVTPSRGSSFALESSKRRSSKRYSANKSETVLEITDSTRNSSIRRSDISTRSRKSSHKSTTLSSPKKSAMKDHSKKSTRKTESIKFDLSNLEIHQDSNEVLLVSNATQRGSGDSMTEEDLTLRYSESPSPRKSINSRSGRMLENLGLSPKSTEAPSRTVTPDSPRARRSIRASMLQKAMESSALSDDTKTGRSANTTVASAFRTRTLSPRSNTNLESYSVIDLVSLDSNDTSKSVYSSADSRQTKNDLSSSTAFGTPNSRRNTRSTINPTLIGSSTPYVGGARATRSKSSSNITQNISTRSAVSTRRSKSLSTPENQQKPVNNTKRSRASRSRSRINDSDLLLLDETEEEDSSPKTSKRARATKSVTTDISKLNMSANSTESGIVTPENRYSPEAAGTPVLSIQSLLDSSRSSLNSQGSGRRGRRSADYKKNTVGVLSKPETRQSLGRSVRKAMLRLSIESDQTDEGAPQPDNEEVVTPKSAIKITPEDLKNKHSTAKKPKSRRSMIDDLNQSDIVKHLFNSPVKRKLSQSMMEFSRKRLFDDEDEDDDVAQARRPTRNTVALSGTTQHSSILEYTEAVTPERFVSPLHTPSTSPELSGLDRLIHKNTAGGDLSNVRGVKGLQYTPRARRSIKNDLTDGDVQGVKTMYAKSPRNRPSDIRVKERFAVSPKNDLTDVRGVRKMFKRKSPRNDLTDVRGVRNVFRRKSPENDLTDVRGVRRMFKNKSPENDLRNVSGVKRIMSNKSPKNDLTDVRGVRQTFRQPKQKENYHDVSGVEELFNETNQSANRSETLFDTLFGKPTVKSVYSKSFSTKLTRKSKTRTRKSLHSSIEMTTDNVEEWLQRELQKRLHKEVEPSTSRSKNNSKSFTDRELQKLSTDTVEGSEAVRGSRTRNSSFGKSSASLAYSAHMLPIKKRSTAGMSKRLLPIKKRQVLHSTPVKGSASLVMNASELGRVSPIAAADQTRVLGRNASVTRSTDIITDEEPRAKLVKTRTPRKQDTPKKIDISKSSPSTPVAKPSRSTRATRNRKTSNVSMANTKKRKTSIVVTKKAPVMSPTAPTATSSKKVSAKASPKNIRATRSKKEQKVETPKRTRVSKKEKKVVTPKRTRVSKKEEKVVTPKRTRVSKKEEKVETPKRTKVRAAKATVVVLKPSPKLKPQPNAKAAGKSQTEEKISNRTNKTTAAKPKVESPKIAPGKSRKTRTNATEQSETIGKEPKTKPVQTKRGRKAANVVQPVSNINAVESNVLGKTKTRGRKPAAAMEPKAEVKQPRTRGKQVATQDSVQSEPSRGRGKKAEPVVVEKNIRNRGKKAELEAKPEQTQSRTRGKKAAPQTSVESEPRKKVKVEAKPEEPQTRTRGRRTKAEVSLVPETKERKRKGAAIEELPSKVAKTGPKGKKAEASVKETTGKQKRALSKGKNADNSEPEPVKLTRGTRLKRAEEVNKPGELPVRGRRAAKTTEKVAEPARGTRRANTERSPAKEPARADGRSRRR